MADFILVKGDKVKFNPLFGLAVVTVQDGELDGTGKAVFDGSAVCIEGDEASVSVSDCPYFAGPFSVPGTGTLTIQALGGDQTTTKLTVDGKPALLKGTLFIAEMEVSQKAKNPANGMEDQMTTYIGSGTFENSNAKWKGT